MPLPLPAYSKKEMRRGNSMLIHRGIARGSRNAMTDFIIAKRK